MVLPRAVERTCDSAVLERRRMLQADDLFFPRMDGYPMLKFNAHLGFQFNELPFLQRFEAAAEAGFRAVEFPVPYGFDASLLADQLAQYVWR